MYSVQPSSSYQPITFVNGHPQSYTEKTSKRHPSATQPKLVDERPGLQERVWQAAAPLFHPLVEMVSLQPPMMPFIEPMLPMGPAALPSRAVLLAMFEEAIVAQDVNRVSELMDMLHICSPVVCEQVVRLYAGEQRGPQRALEFMQKLSIQHPGEVIQSIGKILFSGEDLLQQQEPQNPQSVESPQAKR